MSHLVLVKVRFVCIEQLTMSTAVTKGDAPRMNSEQTGAFPAKHDFSARSKAENPVQNEKWHQRPNDYLIKIYKLIRGRKNFRSFVGLFSPAYIT